jgi:hypothetical protein
VVDLSGTIVPIIGHFFKTMALNRASTLSSSTESMETKMRKRALPHLGVLVIAALTIQSAAAATHHARKPVRNTAPVTHQLRDAYGSAPEAVGSKSCDVIWCYED